MLQAVDSQLVAHPRIFRLLMKWKFDAYVLWPLVKRVQNWIVDKSTALTLRYLLCRRLLKICKLDYFSFYKVAVVSFGRRVAWKQTRTEGQTIPRWFTNASIIHVILMGTVTAIKLIFQVCIFNILISGSSYKMNLKTEHKNSHFCRVSLFDVYKNMNKTNTIIKSLKIRDFSFLLDNNISTFSDKCTWRHLCRVMVECENRH